MSKPHLRLLVTSVPPGEAPEWVRQKWVGLSLPLAQRDATPKVFPTAGVLSGPRNVLTCLFAWLTGKLVRESGYMVESLAAIQVLEATHPEAAAWWKQNTPHLIRAHRYFVFQQGVGHVSE